MVSEPHFDGCEVVGKLRSGSATEWYLGRQRSLGRAVVIKALSPNVLPESPFAGPLAQEAKLLAQLQHKNIIQLYEFVQQPRNMWLVLEHVDGITLEELLEKLGRVRPPTALAIVEQLVATLAYVHSRGVVHRDVQPKNIWLSREGEVKLGNFFLAAEQSIPAPPELLEAESGFESPSYKSPEQLLSEPTDPRSDLFSIGVILFEMVTGQRPFDASDTRTTTQRIRHEPAPPISRFAPDVPAAIERVVVRALQKLPADRFVDAGEMAVMVDEALAQYGNPNPRTLILEELGLAGVVEAAPVPVTRQPEIRQRSSVLMRAIGIYFACFLLLALGAFLIRRYSQKPTQLDPTRPSALELAPEGAATLSVVARPWAHVFVDGQHVATTPFATPIPLRPGTHHLRFEHPNAPPEQRTVTVARGQRLLLDIELLLAAPPPDPDPDLIAPPVDAGASP